MRGAAAMGPLKCILVFIVTITMTNLVEAYIVVGAGYSEDMQQMVPQRCYNATVASTSGQQGYVQLDTAVSFTELENVLGITLGAGVSFGVFSLEAEVSYTRSLEDKDYSLSLNYYQYATNDVAVQLAGVGEEALTLSGREFYNGSRNPYFGLLCGDYYIKSYQQGALLTMGLNLKLSSSVAKKEFGEKAGVTFYDIVSVTESVKHIASQSNITGSLIMQAFQKGGDPNQLANVLNKDSSGQYYALACSLDSMDKCIKAASGLLDYAKNNFSKQFSFENNTGLTPLGIAYTQYNPIKYISLIPPPSLVTSEVAQYRSELYSKLMENQYYQQKIYPFFSNGYPVQLEATFMRNASLILSKAKKNEGILMQAHKGAADCFNFPDRCGYIKSNIDSKLEDITMNDLKFLEDIKYTVTTVGGMFYNTGGKDDMRDPNLSFWRAVPINEEKKEILDKVNTAYISDVLYIYFIEAHVSNSRSVTEFYFNGQKTSDSLIYEGYLLSRPKGSGAWATNETHYKENMLISPYFFNSYNITK